MTRQEIADKLAKMAAASKTTRAAAGKKGKKPVDDYVVVEKDSKTTKDSK